MTLQVILWGVAVAAGAGFVWARERHMPSYDEQSPDRRMRLALPGVIWLGIFFWPIHLVYTNYFSTFGSNNPRHPPVWVWVLCSVAPAVPWLVGNLYGWTRKQMRLRERRQLGRHIQRQTRIKDPIPPRSYPSGFDYVMERITGELGTDNPPMVSIIFTYPNDSKPYVVVGQIGYAPYTPGVRDIYLDFVYFFDTYEEWIWFENQNQNYKLLEYGFLISYTNVMYMQIIPRVI